MRIFNIDIMHVNKLTLTSTNQVLYNLTGKEFKTHVIHQSLAQKDYTFDGGAFNIQKLANIVDLIFKSPDNIDIVDCIYNVKNFISKAYKPRPNSKYLLGEGCFSYVYQINDKYAVKIPKHGRLYNDIDVVRISSQYEDLSTYAGNISIKCGKVQIMQNIGKGIAAGIPYNSCINEAYKVKAIKYYHNRYLPNFSKISQKSYNTLVQDLVKLNNRYDETGFYYIIDYCNPNNIVLSGNKLRLVDDIGKDEAFRNSMVELLDMLLGSCSDYGKSLNHARTIFKKVVKASMSEGLPISSGCFGINPYDLFVMRVLLDSLKIKAKSEWVLDNFNEISNIPDKNLRLNKTNKFLDEVFSDKYAIRFT